MNSNFLHFVEEQFSFLGLITIKKMFGGAGIYVGDLIFGIVVEDSVYLKVGENTKGDYEAIGMAPFTYESNKKSIAMSYYQLPEEILEDVDELRPWAEKAVSVARATKKSKKPKKKSKGI